MSLLNPEQGGGFSLKRRPDLEYGGSPFQCEARIRVMDCAAQVNDDSHWIDISLKGLTRSDLETLKKEINRILREAKS